MQNHNQEVEYTYAGFWMRFAAFAVDGIVLTIGTGIIHAALMVFMSFLKDTPLGGEILFQYTLTDIVEYLLKAVYFVLLTFFTGSTLGKKLLSLKVVSLKENEKPGLLDVIYRETIGRYLSGICLGIGYLMAGIDKEKRALHDILCDTRVVHVRKIPAAKAAVVEMVPRMVEEPEKQGYSQEEIEQQWKQILNTNNDEQDIEGNS